MKYVTLATLLNIVARIQFYLNKAKIAIYGSIDQSFEHWELEHLELRCVTLESQNFIVVKQIYFKNMQKNTWIGGHTSPILCLDVNKEGILASGGEDELCIWSKDGSTQSKLPRNSQSGEVNSVCFCVKNPERLYASRGNRIIGYDLRNPSSAVCEFQFNADEINQLAVHDKGNFLAACDDSGEIKVIDVQSRRLFKTLHSKHDNICSTVQFRPNRPWEIVSAGMDYTVVSWDFSSGRALQELNVQELEGDSQEGAYFVNPPFVHSIHMTGNGRMFAAGLGNGSIQLFRFEGKKKFVPDECLRKHSSSASQVHFPKFSPDDVLVSGGDDCKLVVWNLSSGECNGTSAAAENDSTQTSADNVNHEVEHGSKINWIASSSLTQNIFVSDVTHGISVYSVT